MSDRLRPDKPVSKKKDQSRGEGSRWAAIKGSPEARSLTWWEAEPVLLRDSLAAVTEEGAAVLLSKTSDGGALVIQVIDDDGTNKLYPASTQELSQYLNRMMEACKTA